ncbi:hypothetical protein ACHAXS_007698 [Conticribra weissflogii]
MQYAIHNSRTRLQGTLTRHPPPPKPPDRPTSPRPGDPPATEHDSSPLVVASAAIARSDSSSWIDRGKGSDDGDGDGGGFRRRRLAGDRDGDRRSGECGGG